MVFVPKVCVVSLSGSIDDVEGVEQNILRFVAAASGFVLSIIPVGHLGIGVPGVAVLRDVSSEALAVPIETGRRSRKRSRRGSSPRSPSPKQLKFRTLRGIRYGHIK